MFAKFYDGKSKAEQATMEAMLQKKTKNVAAKLEGTILGRLVLGHFSVQSDAVSTQRVVSTVPHFSSWGNACKTCAATGSSSGFAAAWH